jgi:acetyltransferase-like isoleucine patch superfamily enzyme
MVRRILKRLLRKPVNAKPYASLKNVSIGVNSDFTGSLDKSRAPESTLIIGKDCLIACNIALETNEARIEIGDNVFIGQGTRIVSSNYIRIESDVLISGDCLIQDSDNHSFNFDIRKNDLRDWKNGFHDWSKHPCIPIKILHGAWIGAKVIILKGNTIGEKAVVGAGSVVTKSVDPLTVVGGNPAKLIKRID